MTARPTTGVAPALRVEPATFAWMAEHAQSLRELETTRGEGLDAKAATLAGFAGVVLSVIAALAPRVGDGSAVAAVLLALALALLVAAAVAALGALLPRRTAQLGVGELEQFLSPPFATAAAADVQSRTIRATVTMLRVNQAVNDRKARLLQLTAVSLAGGLLAVSALALTLQLDGRSNYQNRASAASASAQRR
jgi:hypothetical protein